MKISSLSFYLQHPVHALGKVADVVHRKFHPENPWLTSSSVKSLSRLLNNGSHIGLEWGSGKSTLWFSKYCRELHSIEYDKEWHNIVSKMLEENDVTNTQLYYIPLEHPRQEPTYAHYDQLPMYVTKVNNFEDEYFTFILVDGHYRQACVLSADKKLKFGGYLIIDNYNRVKTKKDWGVPDSYKLIHQSSNIVTTTAIFQKT